MKKLLAVLLVVGLLFLGLSLACGPGKSRDIFNEEKIQQGLEAGQQDSDAVEEGTEDAADAADEAGDAPEDVTDEAEEEATDEAEEEADK